MTDAEFGCRLDVFDATERQRYAALRTAVKAAVTEIRELADGYAARLTPEPGLFQQASEWITLEHRCCPFLALGLEWSTTEGVWLRLTGGPGVKKYLRDALASRS